MSFHQAGFPSGIFSIHLILLTPVYHKKKTQHEGPTIPSWTLFDFRFFASLIVNPQLSFHVVFPHYQISRHYVFLKLIFTCMYVFCISYSKHTRTLRPNVSWLNYWLYAATSQLSLHNIHISRFVLAPRDFFAWIGCSLYTGMLTPSCQIPLQCTSSKVTCRMNQQPCCLAGLFEIQLVWLVDKSSNVFSCTLTSKRCQGFYTFLENQAHGNHLKLCTWRRIVKPNTITSK